MSFSMSWWRSFPPVIPCAVIGLAGKPPPCRKHNTRCQIAQFHWWRPHGPQRPLMRTQIQGSVCGSLFSISCTNYLALVLVCCQMEIPYQSAWLYNLYGTPSKIFSESWPSDVMGKFFYEAFAGPRILTNWEMARKHEVGPYFQMLLQHISTGGKEVNLRATANWLQYQDRPWWV